MTLCAVCWSEVGRWFTWLSGSVEARTADVFTGPCFANSEVELTGDLAVMGWKIDKGSWQGVKLDGLGVVGVVKASATLGDVHNSAYPVKSVLIVDEKATKAQRDALVAFVKAQAGKLAGDVVVGGQLVVRAADLERSNESLGGKNAGEDRCVAALDARHVHEAGRAADQRAAGEDEARHALPAALGDGPRAIADAPAALEGLGDGGVRLEALELVEGRQVRVVVVEVDDEADGDEIVAEMIEEGAAAGAVAERPAEAVLDEAGPVALRLDLPQFLDAEAELRRLGHAHPKRAAEQLYLLIEGALAVGASEANGRPGLLARDLAARVIDG